MHISGATKTYFVAIKTQFSILALVFKVKTLTLKMSLFYECYRMRLVLNIMLKTDLAKPGRIFAFKQIALSIILVLMYALITYIIWGITHFQSVIIGGFVVIIPNVFFALKAFRYAGARSTKKVLESFYSGEKMKMLIMAILTALTFKILTIEPIAFFTSFSLVLVVPLLTSFLFKL